MPRFPVFRQRKFAALQPETGGQRRRVLRHLPGDVPERACLSAKDGLTALRTGDRSE